MSDIYREITDQIVQALENGVRPWHQPWNAAHMEGRVALPSRHNGVAYRGVNVLANQFYWHLGNLIVHSLLILGLWKEFGDLRKS